ncbi:uncharacterized protein YALI1_D34061g [Yarrowia lipolytica]|uniref:Uncharacterized protein n=1 Tax=Yarrowia lipolytica TaxID=4952 RepID=A0A1D8NGA0_YARLL|nr:hypothetical protein YALI1_D34061g [Yarrowia lipolytica]
MFQLMAREWASNFYLECLLSFRYSRSSALSFFCLCKTISYTPTALGDCSERGLDVGRCDGLCEIHTDVTTHAKT